MINAKPKRRGQGSTAWIASKGRYRISVPRLDRPDDPIREWFPGPQSPAQFDRADARRIEILAHRNAGGSTVVGTGSVAEWLDEWLARQDGPKVRAYRSRIDLYLVPALGRKRLKDLGAPDIRKAYARLRLPADQRPRPRDGRAPRVELLSESTILAVHKVLSAALNDARREDPPLIKSNPCELVDVIADDPEIQPPTIDQVDAMLGDLAARDDAYLPLYLAMRWSGARQGELFGLLRDDVSRQDRTLTFRRQLADAPDQHGRVRRRRLKAGRTRTVVVPQFVVDAILDQPVHHRSPLAFTRADGTGRPMTQGVLKGHFDRLVSRLGICPPHGADLDHFRPHDFRHAFATMMREAGADDHRIQAAMGHASVTMLERYSHIVPRRGGQAYQLVVGALGADDARDFYGIRA